MRLSIIVPMYNAANYIRECLDSLLDQGFRNDEYEILIINDGSRDNGLAIAEDYAAHYNNIRIYNQQNRGQSIARNIGIDMALGDYICFVDADDFLVRNRLALLTDIAEKNKVEILTYGILGGTYSLINEKLKTLEFHIPSLLEVQNGIEYIANHNYNNGAWYYLINRLYLKNIGLTFVPGRKCEDGMFTMSLFLTCNRILHVDLEVYCYVIRENSTVTSNNSKHLMQMIDDFQFAINYLSHVIECKKSTMSQDCLQRCLCRRDSYIFFLFVRMLKAKVPSSLLKNVIFMLKKQGLYPIASINVDYPSKKITILRKIFNIPILYYSLCLLYRLLK